MGEELKSGTKIINVMKDNEMFIKNCIDLIIRSDLMLSIARSKSNVQVANGHIQKSGEGKKVEVQTKDR
jgi:hypothetical protein